MGSLSLYRLGMRRTTSYSTEYRGWFSHSVLVITRVLLVTNSSILIVTTQWLRADSMA